MYISNAIMEATHRYRGVVRGVVKLTATECTLLLTIELWNLQNANKTLPCWIPHDANLVSKSLYIIR